MKKNNIPDLRFPQFNEPWTVKKLGEVCEINPKTKDLPKQFIYIDLESVNNGILNNINIIDKAEAPSRAQRLLQDKDILFQMVRPYQKNNLFYLDVHKLPAVASTGYAQIRTLQYKTYIYQYLNTDAFNSQVLNACTGTSYPAINSSDLSSLPISLPTLPEQQKIADFLSGVDEKIGQLERRLALEEQYKKGMMQRLFDQEIRFKDENGNEFPDWEEKKLGEVCERIKDGTHGSHKEVSKGKYLLSAKDIKNGRVICSSDSRIISEEDFNSIHKNYKIENGDVLLTLVGTIGQSAIVQNYNENYTFQRSVGILKVNKTIFNKYLFQLISSSSFQSKLVSHSNSSAQAGVYLKTLSSLPISLPTLPEQQKMADFLSSLDDKIGQTKAELDKARDWKRGLMQRMFV